MNDQAKLYVDRRRRMAEVCEVEVLTFCANKQVQETASIAYPFSQDRNFFYLTGIDSPDWILVINVANGEEFLVAPEANDIRDTFDGRLSDQQAAQISGVEVLDFRTGSAKLRQLVKESNSVGTLFANEPYLKRQGMFSQPSRKHFVDKLKRYNSAESLVDVRKQMAEARMVKQPEEIAEIDAMAKTTHEILELVKRNLINFANERDIEKYLDEELIKRDLKHNYTPIIATTGNGATIHYTDNNAPISQNDLLLIDFGVKKHFYGADITRTFEVGKADKFKLDVLSRVKDVQQKILDLVKPGVTLKDLEVETERLIGEHLEALGLINSQLKKHIRQFYPHAVSHFLGLDVHDVGNYEKPLVEGVVLTVEPGIYSAKHQLGVRFEDDVVVTSSGHRVLGV